LHFYAGIKRKKKGRKQQKKKRRSLLSEENTATGARGKKGSNISVPSENGQFRACVERKGEGVS